MDNMSQRSVVAASAFCLFLSENVRNLMVKVPNMPFFIITIDKAVKFFYTAII